MMASNHINNTIDSKLTETQSVSAGLIIEEFSFSSGFICHVWKLISLIIYLIFIHGIKGEIKWSFMANVRAGESNYFT